MATYVRRADNDTWHWCTNCSNYPEPHEIAERRTLPTGQRPSGGELDNECLSKENAGLCKS
jgi:hypothetical protein